jgi:hypothetical protein
MLSVLRVKPDTMTLKPITVFWRSEIDHTGGYELCYVANIFDRPGTQSVQGGGHSRRASSALPFVFRRTRWLESEALYGYQP